MFNPIGNSRGIGTFSSVLMFVIILAAIYGVIKLATPFHAYKDLEGTMQYWAESTLYQGTTDYTELLKNVMEKVDWHDIPLEKSDIQIEYNEGEKTLRVYAEYDVYVDFPGYSHAFHFSPEGFAWID